MGVGGLGSPGASARRARAEGAAGGPPRAPGARWALELAAREALSPQKLWARPSPAPAPSPQAGGRTEAWGAARAVSQLDRVPGPLLTQCVLLQCLQPPRPTPPPGLHPSARGFLCAGQSMVSEELLGSGHTGRAPHPQLLWAYSGGGAGPVGGAGPTLWPAQGSIPGPPEEPDRSRAGSSDRPSAGSWEAPYLMAGPRVACHVLDHDGEQALTEHLRRERRAVRWAVRTGPSRVPRGRPGTTTHRVPGEEAEEHGSCERAAAPGQEGAQRR